MSLQNAAAGFGAYCINNNIIFNVPLLGSIAIGAKRADVEEGFNKTCQRKLDLRYASRDQIYSDESGEVLVFSIIGVYISGFRFHGAASQIPQNLIYTYKGKSYITNICIDGHMIWIKNMNEIKLKAVSDVPCNNVTLEQLGVKLERITKDSINRTVVAGNKFWDDSKKKQSVKVEHAANIDSLASDKKIIEDSISKLSDKLYNLNRKIKKYQNRLESAEIEFKKYTEAYRSALAKLNGTYSPGWKGYTLQNLIELGKLRKDKYGAYVLAEGSQTPTFYTEEDALEIEHDSRKLPGYEVLNDMSTHMGTWYVQGRTYKKQVEHRDEAYYRAADWCHSIYYEKYHREVVKAYNEMLPYKEHYDKAKHEAEAVVKTPEYIALCVEYANIKKVYEVEKDRLRKLESKLYT